LKIVLNPPISVGTGFKNLRPIFFARCNIVISLEYHTAPRRHHPSGHNQGKYGSYQTFEAVASSAYNSPISFAYLASTTLRFSFMLGVNVPSSTLHSSATTHTRFILS
jgi:hypothetical protein